MKLSIIIPIYNEEDNIHELYKRLTSSLNKDFINFEYEIIFVDDGSNDNSFELLKNLHHQDKNIKIIQLSRNFGQHIAIAAGIDSAVGDYTILMDGDLQESPEDIIKLYNKIKDGYNVVIGVRANRQDSLSKKIFSHIFFKIINTLSTINMIPNQTTLRIFDRKVLEALQRIREINQTNGAFLAWLGFKQTVCPVAHSKRIKGKTKYNFWRGLRFAIDTIISFSNKPLIYISLLGLFISGGSIIYAGYVIIAKIFYGILIQGWASIIVIIAFLGGLILFSLGVIGLYIGRIYQQSLSRPLYIISNKIE